MTNTAKIAKIIYVTKFKTQKKRRQDGPRNVRKNRKFYKDLFLLPKNTHGRDRKNRKNNKCNKIQDLERKEAKKGLEMLILQGN